MSDGTAAERRGLRARPTTTVALALLAALILALAGPGGTAEAASFLVNLTADAPDPSFGDGRCDIDANPANGDQCTLRAAIQQANALAGSHTIQLLGGVYALTRTGPNEDAAATGDLDITRAIAISGVGPQATFIQAGADGASAIDRVFDVQPGGSLTLSLLTVRNGRVGTSMALSPTGGVIRALGGSVTLSFVELTGGISTALGQEGPIQDRIGGDGGGIAVGPGNGQPGALTATNTTIAENSAGGHGGGILNDGGVISLTNVTLAGNRAATAGAIATRGAATLSFVTVSRNDLDVGGSVGGLDARGATGQTLLRGSLLSENDGDDCVGPAASEGSNIVDDGGCIQSPAPGDLLQEDEDVPGLAFNGGLVRTQAPRFGQRAIDGVHPGSPAAAACPATDARGIARAFDGDGDGIARCDIGAHEIRSFTVNIPADLTDAAPGNGRCDADAAASGDQCTLRAAMMEAGAAPDPIAVVVPAGTYRLTIPPGTGDGAASGDLSIDRRVAVIGAGAATTTVDGGGNDRVFDIQFDGNARISGLRITGGNVNLDGGGIRAIGIVSLFDSIVEGNTARDGGGLATRDQGSITMRRVTVRDNTATRKGGGLRLLSSLGSFISESAIVGNRAEETGGGIELDGSGGGTLANVTVSGNRANLEGGGIMATGGTLTVTHTTIAENRADSQGFIGAGQGIRVVFPGSVDVRSSIVGPNGLLFEGQRVGENCGGAVIARGHSVSSDASCGLTGPGDLQGTDPRLAPLASNGGPTQTHALLAGSPAIDRVPADSVACLATDQRGLPRRVDADGNGQPNCDSGAFEVQGRACEPRPPVRVAVAPSGNGRVTVTVRPGANEGTTANRLRRIRFGPASGATLDLGQSGTSRGNVTVTPPSPDAFSFVMLPDGPGVPSHAPFVVEDECGDWPTFAGAGRAVTTP